MFHVFLVYNSDRYEDQNLDNIWKWLETKYISLYRLAVSHIIYCLNLALVYILWNVYFLHVHVFLVNDFDKNENQNFDVIWYQLDAKYISLYRPAAPYLIYNLNLTPNTYTTIKSRVCGIHICYMSLNFLPLILTKMRTKILMSFDINLRPNIYLCSYQLLLI